MLQDGGNVGRLTTRKILQTMQNERQSMCIILCKIQHSASARVLKIQGLLRHLKVNLTATYCLEGGMKWHHFKGVDDIPAKCLSVQILSFGWLRILDRGMYNSCEEMKY